MQNKKNKEVNQSDMNENIDNTILNNDEVVNTNDDMSENDEITDTQSGQTVNTDENTDNTGVTNNEETKTTVDFEKKYNEINDRYLRLSAEFDNYRKRTLKEKMDMVKSAGEKVLIDILPVIDNMERALKAIDKAREVEPVKEGINLIYTKFTDFLAQQGIKEIEALHKELDAELHEAVTKFAAPSDDLKGKVIDVVEKGYYLNDKIIRFAKVVVGE